ncbi:MAG TPA: alanine--tRNA ligase, partial [Deltaproteobacteria bacterium]|nr:alanine--tRNA ligase [Deltaproteobacteria bacterium]
DTGMGLERLAAVLQKKKSNYDTDLFQPILQYFAKRTGKVYGANPNDDVSLRVLSDHLRAAGFLVGDGVQPSNEGRGYVLRRIMRRAIRHGKILGMKEPFFHEGIGILVREMGGAYPDLKKNQSFIEKVVKTEEERFLETLENGLGVLEEKMDRAIKQGRKEVSGELAFRLYDTFGFPLDLTQLIAEERGLIVDQSEFDRKMDEQKKRARAAWKGSGQEKVGEIYRQIFNEKGKTKFVGYEALVADSKITALLVEGQVAKEVNVGQSVEVCLDQTPFYGESGGQMGDSGIISSSSGKIQIEDTQKPVDGLWVHHGKVLSGSFKAGEKVHTEVSSATRRPTMLNHTGTHILHAALREILGDHVKQAGSLVDAERLRFDFSHFEALTPEQIQKIETRVNEVIQANYPVTKEEMSLEQAQKKGALAFFGEKYGDRVRVVTVGPYSMEFCGGTHLNASGEIGLFKITSESSVASGVRRIEAITGMAAFKAFQEQERTLKQLADTLKATPLEVSDRVKKMNDRMKALEQEISKLKTKVASGGAGADYMSQVKEINGVKLLAFEAEIDDPKALRDFSDQVKNRLGSGIVVLASKSDGKVSLLVTVSKDLTSKYQAGKIVGELAQIVGGKGGGRPDMAQAGGNQPEKISEVFKRITELL